MNERIRQLAEQACAFADIQYNKQTKATFYTNKSVEEFFREKFAELIVRECADVVDIDAILAHRVRSKMFDHFGVDE